MAEIAWLDCPYGRTNDPYPGQCELYTDTNSDQICDHSQPPPLEGLESREGIEGMIAFLTLGIYLVHWSFVHKTKFGEKFWWLGRRQFCYFWNLVLLLSFLPVAVSGLLWVLGKSSTTLSFWHYRTGLVFTVVASLHLLKRFRHFLKIPYR